MYDFCAPLVQFASSYFNVTIVKMNIVLLDYIRCVIVLCCNLTAVQFLRKKTRSKKVQKEWVVPLTTPEDVHEVLVYVPVLYISIYLISFIIQCTMTYTSLKWSADFCQVLCRRADHTPLVRAGGSAARNCAN